MSRLKSAVRTLPRVAIWIVGLWLLQAALAAWLSEPLFQAGAPLQDDELFEEGALMLSELVLTQRDELISAFWNAAPRAVLSLFLLGLARFQLMRAVAKNSGLFQSHHETRLAAWNSWWLRAFAYFGVAAAQSLALLTVLTGASWGLLRLERASGSTLPPGLVMMAALLALATAGIILMLNVVSRMAQLQLATGQSLTHAAMRWLSSLRHYSFSLAALKLLCVSITTAFALLVTLALGPASALGALPWLTGIALQLLLLISLALETLWLAFAAESSKL